MTNKKIKVLIVDDSAISRDIIARGLSTDPEIEITGKAANAFAARDLIELKKPDVITLDIEMPKMNGLEFLKRLMAQYPVPVVMVSSYTESGSKATIEALNHGAVDFVLKPSVTTGSTLVDMIGELISKVKMASKAHVGIIKSPQKMSFNEVKPLTGTASNKIIVLGASTGGVEAISHILPELPANLPGIVIAQHMPAIFTRLFAERVDQTAAITIKEAEDGEKILDGTAYIAPGGLQTRIIKRGSMYTLSIKEDDTGLFHKPSVDVLFHSAAEQAAKNALGIILTGMGADGAKGLLAMRKKGARTLGQDENSSIVFGMPYEAHRLGAVERLVSLQNMAHAIIGSVNTL